MDHRIIEIAPPGPPEDPHRNWPEKLRREFAENAFNGAVGNILVSENERVRVWHLFLPPGGWLTFHRHILDYFWTTPSTGIARGYYQDGRICDVHHYPGETRFFDQDEEDFFIHAIENVGDTDLIFVTVEFLDVGKPKLGLEDHVRLKIPAAKVST
jgi:hypothetical protein